MEPFDLEKAVAAWRHVLARRRTFSTEDLDELERHLRDHTAHLTAGGRREDHAFREALEALGDFEGGEAEYRKVRWGKLRRRHEIAGELMYRLTLLQNYLKIAWRNVRREKGYAFINVFGLGVGIAFCILIFLFVHDEVTYDRMHEKRDRLFRVEETMLGPDGSDERRSISGPVIVGPTLKAEVPGIEQFMRFVWMDHHARSRGSATNAIEEAVLFADPAVLTAFSFPLLRGNPATALDAPHQVVLTESVARRHFGVADPIGEILQVRLDRTFEDFVVTGVAADLPGNSTIQFDVLISFE